MKNEFDMFAEIQRRLAANAPLVTLRIDPHGADGNFGKALDEDGAAYVLGPDYPAALPPFLRSLRTSFCIDWVSCVLQAGPGLKVPSREEQFPGYLWVDLLNRDWKLSDYFEEQDDTCHGEEWKSLL